MKNFKERNIGDLLLDSGLISLDQLNYALEVQKSTGKEIVDILIMDRIANEELIIKVLEDQLGIVSINLNEFYIDPEVPKLINENLARRHVLIPIKKVGNKVIVAMGDPLNSLAIEDIRIATGFEVIPAISGKKDILKAIDLYYEKDIAENAFEEFKKYYDINEGELDKETLNDINNAPVVRIVNSIIKRAVKSLASDIHIEPFDDIVKVRFRIDGDLHEIMTQERVVHSAIVTRIKIMGKMDIAEKRLPQDGSLETVVENKAIDLRISILPSVHGEKVVIRILSREKFNISKEELGFNKTNLMLFNSMIKSPNGIVLVTGPTGSGKNTTLYSALRELNISNRNIITVEDPVEYQVKGITQVQVNNKAGLTFAKALRAILRQDPDIIMIGEIRDSETAQIAIRASITGHLVLSTMHTNDTASTIIRLIDMGIEPYLVASSLVGVVAQRLVKRICCHCKIQYKAKEFHKRVLMLDKSDNVTIFKGEGCKKCNYSGYRGRIAVHEVMLVNKEIRKLINSNATIDEIRELALRQNMQTLRQSSAQIALEGITTVDEVIKASFSLE